MSRSLTWPLWREALLSWGIPLLLIGAFAAVALLGFLDLIGQMIGVAALGGLLLLITVFFTFRTVLLNIPQPRCKAWAVGLCLAWVGITLTQFACAVWGGQQVSDGTLNRDTGVPLTLEGPRAAYDFVVEGNFVPTSGETEREAKYRLSLEKEGRVIHIFDGTFSEHWVRQRLGRRGSTRSRQVHDHELHRVSNIDAGTYRLTLLSLDPQLQPTLHVTLYRDVYPRKTFWLLDALLFIGAYTLEASFAGKEVPLVLVSATTIAFLLTFRNIEVPPPNYRHFIGATMIAVIAGPLGGWSVRLFADSLRRRLRRPQRPTHSFPSHPSGPPRAGRAGRKV